VRPDRYKQIAAALVAVLLVAAAGWREERLREVRAKMGLVESGATPVGRDDEPVVAIAKMFGAFRGLAIDYFWIRSQELKQDGKYYEALQLAETITTLQPKFPAVWDFMAWDMAWNISVGCHTPEERWKWVHNGIKLLRDKGITRHNPNALVLYRSLSWIFLNKMGERTDDMHGAYKMAWVSRMHALLGALPADADREAALRRLEAIRAAPRQWSALVAEHPRLDAIRTEWAAWGIDLLADNDEDAEFHPLEVTFFRRYAQLVQDVGPDSGMQIDETQLAPEAAAFRRFFVDPASQPAADALLAFLRSGVLRDRYKMDLDWMITCTQRYGPLDWRTVEAHGIYWASLGVQRAADLPGSESIDAVNTDRNVFISLANLHDRGHLIYRPWEDYLDQMPDLRFIEPLHQAYLAMMEQTAGEEERYSYYETGHRNFLADGIRSLFYRNRRDEADRYLVWLRRNTDDPKYDVPLADFVQHKIREAVESHDGAKSYIEGHLRLAYTLLARGDVGFYRQYRRQAMAGRQLFIDQYKGAVPERMKMKPFDQMELDALVDFFRDRGLSVWLKLRLWRSPTLSEATKSAVYGRLRRTFEEICEQISRAQNTAVDVNRAFPPPAGWKPATTAPVE